MGKIFSIKFGFFSYLVVALIIALTGMTMEWISDTALVNGFVRRAIAHIFAPVDSYLYNQSRLGAPARNPIIVVNLDKTSLEHFHANWPLSYGQHARVLNKILSYHPTAVFVDIQFGVTRDDPSLSSLQQSLCAYAQAGVPIFLATGSVLNEWRLRPGIEDLRDQSGQPCFKKVTVNYAPDGIDQTAWSYPLKIADTPNLKSAALEMAQAIRGVEIKVDAGETEMGMTWAASANQTGPDWDDQDQTSETRHYCRPPAARDLMPWNGFLSNLGWQVHDFRVACPLHENIEAYRLTAPKSDLQEQNLREQIAGRAVFYGASFEPNDFIVSPLQGRIPGIYLHAMATDNLLRFGNNWLSPDFDTRQGTLAGLLWKFSAYVITTIYFLLLSNFFRKSGTRLRLMLLAKIHKRMPLLLEDKIEQRKAHVKKVMTEKFTPSVRTLKSHHWRLLRSVKVTLETASEPLNTMLSGAVFFFFMLPFASLLCIVFEHVMGISIVGYSEVLVFCLFGEMLGKSHEIHAKIIEENQKNANSTETPNH